MSALPGEETCNCVNGFVEVSEEHVERMAPIPERPLGLTDEQEAAFSALLVAVEANRAVIRNTVYPCKTHRPELFYRWAGKHLHPDHDRDHCRECNPRRTSKPTVRGTAPPIFRRDMA